MDDPTTRYLETQVQTASREQLLLMLFDGAIRFSQQGRTLLEEKSFEASNGRLRRAQEIMLEVMSALDRSVGEELYGKLIGLYRFVWQKLVEANLRRQVAPIDAALKILQQLRDTWGEAVAKARQERLESSDAAAPGSAGIVAAAAAVAAPPTRPGLSVQG